MNVESVERGTNSPARVLRMPAQLEGAVMPTDIRTQTSMLCEMAQALTFKDAVIREAHHRVKNTLQTATSLLTLQAHASASSEVRALLKVASDRLYALGVVHEMLYRHADDAQTILVQPMLIALADSLKDASAEPSGNRIALYVSADDVTLTSDQAIPLALVANEAISNAYKHAFPNGTTGSIAVSLTRTSEAIVLEVRDNGAGMSHTNHPGTLGLSLMRTFAEQLNAAISFTPMAGEAGTLVRLQIPLSATQAHSDVDEPYPAARIGTTSRTPLG
jgi:two-component sensor histidine kinase